jgi:exodeoxyribonuclease-5
MTTTFTVSDLSSDQRVAYDGILGWLRDRSKPTLTLGGYAGTGKSTVTSVVAHELMKLGPIAFCTFTGKASSVLGRKLAESGIATVARTVRKSLLGGVMPFESRPYCGTMHGLVMRPCDVCMVEEEHEHTYGAGCREDRAGGSELVVDGASEVDSSGMTFTVSDARKCLACDPPPPKKKADNCVRCNNARFFKRDRLDRAYRMIIVDEASMVSDDMLDVLKSYQIPILGVGDHGQLKPVRGTGSLMIKPDLRLETIHRQAAGNPIIALSKYIRENGDLDDTLEDGEHFTILRSRQMGDWISKRFTAARLGMDPTPPEGIMGSVMIAWTNRARVSLNHDAREALGTAGKPPQKGEVVICLKNSAPIYNGMRGVLLADTKPAGNEKAPKWQASIDFVEDRQVARDILLSEHQFFAEKTIDYDQAQELGVSMAALGQLYDFGYGLTCHKMQGSQAHDVGVLVEGGLTRMQREDRTRWLYTAVTRAAKHLTVFR